ncbi:MAG: ATP-binding protein [Halobacteria archaeon]|nr:ATP-binding protein [Halobacteria archaeon]
MSSQKGVSPVFDTIYDCLGYERMAVFDVVEDGRLELSVVRGYRDADSPSESLAADSVERHETVIGDESRSAAFPLEIDGEVRKVLVVEVSESETFDETDAELLTTFGSCLSGMVRIADDYSFLIDMLTHDLRNYLSVIKGTQTVRLEEDQDTDEEPEEIRRAYESAVRSEELLEEVRSLAQISRGTEVERTDLKSLVSESVESFGHDVEVETRLPDEDVYVRANEMLVSVLDNLLKNSVEHSRLETDELRVGVTVEICESDDEALLTVEDNGEGIPDEVKRHLFERGVKDEKTGSTEKARRVPRGLQKAELFGIRKIKDFP